jgi:hypothetical protein
MAEEVPAPRAEEVPEVEDVSSGPPPQVLPGGVQRESLAEVALRREEASQRREEGALLEPPTSEEEEMARRQAARDRGDEDKRPLD